jgi:hypothetical protein
MRDSREGGTLQQASPQVQRIRDTDGTGTETIVDVQPSMAGVEKFVRATPDVIPKPGEIILPPSPSPTPAPPATPRPRDY